MAICQSEIFSRENRAQKWLTEVSYPTVLCFYQNRYKTIVHIVMFKEENSSDVLISYIFLPSAASQDDLDYGNVAVFFGAPLITPNEKDITLELGSNATMNCASKYPITWKPFPVRICF